MFHKHIAQKISAKTEENYDRVLSLIRCKLSFLILRSLLICVRGSLSVSNDHVNLDDVYMVKQWVCSKFLRTLLSHLTLDIRKVSLFLTDVNIDFVLLSIFPHYSLFFTFFYTPSNNFLVSYVFNLSF